MAHEQFIPYSPSSEEDLEMREDIRVGTNAFIQDIDKELCEITETPPYFDGSDELLCLCTSLAREWHLQELCYKVEDLITTESPLARINIDNPEGIPEHPPGPANCIDENDWIDATNRGKQAATNDFLRILAPDYDLLKLLSPVFSRSQVVLEMYTNTWRKDLLQNVDFEPFREYTSGIRYHQGGIMTLNLQTRLPTIHYSLVYPPKEQYPARYLYSVDKV